MLKLISRNSLISAITLFNFPSSVAEQEDSFHIHIVLGNEERAEPIVNMIKWAHYRSTVFIWSYLRYEKKQILGPLANVALPEIEDVHIVDRGLPALYLE